VQVSAVNLKATHLHITLSNVYKISCENENVLQSVNQKIKMGEREIKLLSNLDCNGYSHLQAKVLILLILIDVRINQKH
jgi:hypothetical protein